MFRITSPALRPCPHVCSPVRHGNRYSEAFGLSWPRIVQLREAGVGIRTQASRALDVKQSSRHILPATLSPFILTPGLPGESKRPSHHTGTVRMGQTKPLGQGHAGGGVCQRSQDSNPSSSHRKAPCLAPRRFWQRRYPDARSSRSGLT